MVIQYSESFGSRPTHTWLGVKTFPGAADTYE